MKKLSKIMLIIGIVILALSLFFSLCRSDIYRLYEINTDTVLVVAAKDNIETEKANVLLIPTVYPAQAPFTYEGSIAEYQGTQVEIDGKDYYIIDYPTFSTAGGSLKTDKFGNEAEIITDEEGNEYYFGTILIHSVSWDKMNLLQKITCYVSPYITFGIILGIVLLVLFLVFRLIGNYQESGKSFGTFLGDGFTKYSKLILWFVMMILILAAIFAVIVGVYSFINNQEMEECVISRTRDNVLNLTKGNNITAGIVMLVIAIVLIALAIVLKKLVIRKDELAGKAMKFVSDNAIICGIVLLAAFVRLNKDSFFSESNLRNLLSNTAVRFIIAAGVSGCLITKGTDLSAGRMTGFAACLCAIFLQKAGDYANKFYPSIGNLPILPILLAVVAVCAILGAVNGTVISVLKVPPFIATLGMQTLVYGICMVYTGSEPIGTLQPAYTALAQGYFGNRIFSYIAIIALCVGLLMWFLYNKTRYGKYMYAIGGNEVAAEVAGINTRKSKIKIYALAAAMYALTGFIMASKSGGASVNTASGYELEAIAGCTIGGVSVNGGVGKISGILVGVLVFELLKIALQWLGIPSEYTYIAQGLVIIVAVALDLRKYLAKK